MKIGFAALALFGAVSGAQASTLDLLLRVDSIGFTKVEIMDGASGKSEAFDFLDIDDDIWGLPVAFDWFSSGDIVSLTATLDETGQFSSCSLGSFSCIGAFGKIGDTSFDIGDGAGLTTLGDFNLSGGTGIDDRVQLDAFEGVPGYADLAGGGAATWNTFAYKFTVVSDGLAPAPQVGQRLAPHAVPVPASIPLFLTGLGALGLVVRRKRIAA